MKVIDESDHFSVYGISLNVLADLNPGYLHRHLGGYKEKDISRHVTVVLVL